MSTRRPTRERRVQIADAALSILGDLGVHRLTSAELARRVGIADGTIFRHFPNKEAIVAAAIERVSELLFQEFPPAETDPMDRLGRFFVQRVRIVREHPGILRVALSDRLFEAAGATGARAVMEIQARSLAFVRQCIQEAQEGGQLDPEPSTQSIGWMVVGALRGAALVEEDKRGELPSPEQCWSDVARVLRYPCRCDEAGAKP